LLASDSREAERTRGVLQDDMAEERGRKSEEVEEGKWSKGVENQCARREQRSRQTKLSSVRK
jgi:hypothetical protein